MPKESKYHGINGLKRGMPLLSLTLWPTRCCKKKHTTLLITVVFFLMMIPIIPFMFEKTVFMFLPFSLSTIFLLYLCLTLNLKKLKVYEMINIWPSLIEIKRFEINGKEKIWSSNPYWTKTNIYAADQKVENYLTLKGNGREVELGAFLGPNERLEIKEKIDTIIHKI